MDAEHRRAFSVRAVAAGLMLMGLSGWLGSTGAMAQAPKGPDGPPPIKFVHGPARGDLGTVAQIDVPEGFQFTGAEGTRKFQELLENPVDGKELGILMPDMRGKSVADGFWFVIFDFDPIGYVKDGDQKDLTAQTISTILDSIRKGTEAANQERQRRGWATLSVVGWERQPFYDASSHNLVWAIRGSSIEDGKPSYSVNYNTRILGRRGVLSANLVVDPAKLQSVVPTYDKLVKAISFKQGESYGEMRAGDKIAEYGLIGLITGGGVAVALKTGLLTKFLKPILIGIVAVFVAIGKVFKNIFGRSSDK